MPRTIIIGDVHGCLDELNDLLGRVGHVADDRVYFVGDLVARGPSSLGVIDRAMAIGATVVRGNHEHKLVAYRDRDRKSKEPVRLGPTHLEIAEALTEKHWDFLRAMPLWLDLPEHELRIVHAGVMPGLPIEATDPEILLTVRSLTSRGKASSLRAGHVWGRWYQGPPHIVFGHNALMHPQLHVWATGVDTGCVYGGFLTAVVLENGQSMPALSRRDAVLVSVPARRTHYPSRPRPTAPVSRA